MEPLWLIILGLGTGIYSVFVGTGGGLILAPMLLIFFGKNPEAVAGTSLALVAINSFSGTAAYHRLRLIDRRSGLLFAAAALPGSVSAPFIVEHVESHTFSTLLGLILVALALYMLVRPIINSWVTLRPRRSIHISVTTRQITTLDGQLHKYQFNELLATSINLLIGFMAAFFGTGGGFLRTPVLIAVFGFPVRIAIATSVFALSIYATMGATVHAYLGHVDWYPTLFWTGLGLIAGAQIGARMAATIRSEWITRMLVILLLAIGLNLLVTEWLW